MKRINKIAIIIGSALVLFYVAVNAASPFLVKKMAQRMLRIGVASDAVVVGKSIYANNALSKDAGDNRTILLNLPDEKGDFGKISYQFLAENGKRYSATVGVPREIFQKYQVGDMVEIMYDPRFKLSNIKEIFIAKSD